MPKISVMGVPWYRREDLCKRFKRALSALLRQQFEGWYRPSFDSYNISAKSTASWGGVKL